MTDAAPIAAATATPAAGESKTFTLAVPTTDDQGKTYETLTIPEPEVRHLKVLQTSTGSAPVRRAEYLAALASVPIEAIRRLKLRDLNPINDWLNEVENRGALSDIAVEIPQIEALIRTELKLAPDSPIPEKLPDGFTVPELPLEPSRVFDLVAPITTNAEPVVQVTAREPDLEAGIAAERLKTPFDQTTALIATVTGQVIPVISRMKVRDYRRIERWVSRFLPDGNG